MTDYDHMHMKYISFSSYDISELVFYHDFLYRELLLKRKLLNQGFLVAKFKSSFRKFVNRYRVSISQMTPDMFRLS